MKITCLVGSKFSLSTKIAVDYCFELLEKQYSELDVTLIDLKDYDVEFSDGRNFLDYQGDTGYVAKQIMDSDALIIGTPIFQASIPAPLKNIFDLLPINAFRGKVAGIIAIGGSEKHFLVPQQHLKPILGYMKAQIVQTYVFAQKKDFLNRKIVNEEIAYRLKRLVEETVSLMEACKKTQEIKDQEYDF